MKNLCIFLLALMLVACTPEQDAARQTLVPYPTTHAEPPSAYPAPYPAPAQPKPQPKPKPHRDSATPTPGLVCEAC